MVMAQSESSNSSKEKEERSDFPLLQKIAIVMAAVGDTIAGEVVKQLDDCQIESIAMALADLENVTTETMDCVLKEFAPNVVAVESGEEISRGGIDFARATLTRACGPRKAQEILDRCVLSGIDKGIYSDENVRPNEIWMAVKVFPDYVRWALLNQEEEGAWKGIL